MRWLTFILLAAVMLTLQSGITPRLEILGARPDLLLPAVLFFALHAPARAATIGAWCIGVCADLMTIERLGLIALSYLLAAAAVVSVRDYLFRYSYVTQFVVTLAASLLIRIGWTVYSRVVYSIGDSLPADVLTDVLMASVYTAAWAPPLHQVLLWASPAFRVARPRYTYTW